MDIRFLKRVDVDIQGKIVMTTNIDYWLADSFKYTFQDTSSFVQIGGTDINIYGGREINGNDGWDIYRSDNIVIQNFCIFNSDDCVSFKTNSTNILVQNFYCNGSHGNSVGSLGQYVNQVDIVENILVYNTSLNNASDGARIKIWPGAIGNSTNTGGGSGWVRNVTYDGMHNYNNDWAIELAQCYFAPNQTVCNEHPASLVIEDILFKNSDGTTSRKRAPYIATLVCSSPDVCKNIRAENINIVSPGRTDDAICTNMDRSLLDLHCTKG